MVETCIDIAFATLIVSCSPKNSGPKYFNPVNQILRYIVEGQDWGIMFRRESELLLVRYFDSDQAKNYTKRKSTSKFRFMLNGRRISYVSKNQVVVALFSTKAEYITFNLAVRKAK